MVEGAEKIVGLLTYIEQVEKLKRKPAFSIPNDPFVAYQSDLVCLPEVRFNLQEGGDDVWLRVPRLQEIAPPEPEGALKGWLVLSKSPDKRPELKQWIETTSAAGSNEQLRIGDHPEVAGIFNWYVEFLWEPWAQAERSRRRTIKQYSQLFSLQQAIGADGAETPIELVWGIGCAVWVKDGFPTTLKYPLLTQACEVVLDEKTFDLEVRPRDVEPKIELDCYSEMELPGVRQLEAHWRSALDAGANRVNPFEPSTYESTLKAAVGYLDPTGAYDKRAANCPVPSPDNRLKVTDSWVLFARKRATDIFLEDIRKLKKSIEEATELPAVIKSLVREGDSTVRARPEMPFRGLSSSASPTGAFELYFPMPYNDEQVSIVQKLASNDGVVVQGPPGTGKTHTIANVICHYLAQGKRVLVTSKGETALSELQNKLPMDIRPLSVALLSDDHDGMKRFEHSIQAIASNVASLNPTRSQESIVTADARLNQIHAQLAAVDAEISGFAAKHMRHYQFQGRDVSPEIMAKEVLKSAEDHQWFDDEPPPAQTGALPLDVVQISVLKNARHKVGKDLDHVGCPLPSVDELPTCDDICALHLDLIKARAIDASVVQGNVLALSDTTFDTFRKAETLLTFFDERRAIKKQLADGPTLGDTFHHRLADFQENDPLLHSLGHCCSTIRQLDDQRKTLLTKAVQVPENADLNKDYRDAVGRLVAKKSAFSLPFGKADARKSLRETTVMGSAPSELTGWELVQKTIAWRADARMSATLWTAIAQELGLACSSGSAEASIKELVVIAKQVEAATRLRFEFDDSLHPRVAEVFGRAAADHLWSAGEAQVDHYTSSLKSHLERSRLSYAMKRVQEVHNRLEHRRGPIVERIRTFLSDPLGNATVTEQVLRQNWISLKTELGRLSALRPALEDIAVITQAITMAGAPKWAKRSSTIAAESDVDSIVPHSWLEAWNWRQAVMFLDQIDGHSQLRELFEKRRNLTATLATTYQQLVADKTWLAVYNNSPEAVRQALQAYLGAIQSIGAGTGVRAVRHRKTARNAMARAYQAVPCWVLPQWRVSETIPSEVGLFDLVVIDEASQSDIWALPALLRGKKILVVGDDKQVSPSAVGMAEEKVQRLSHRYLADQPHGPHMAPDKSIYDLAMVVFAGNAVRLREHFRCVPAIIEYSNREFYEGNIKPLRLPKSNERLDPPLVDVLVKGGFRKGEINPAEAKAIVDEITNILGDEQFEGKTLGVVTLLGNAQAAHIHELVSRQISPVDIVSRKLSVGPPPIFQGKERDIMLVSMVIGRDDRAVANRADMRQRFNVALSRARDRMYLFRSVAESELREDSLNRRVLEHFKKPFRQDARRIEVLREKCQSDFERDMFDELVRRNFRVIPQVGSKGYHIDFVVEGNEGRRLAIECDGDKFHGPGQWQADMARQRVLERAGWTFWRCFGSSFVRRRKVVLDDLLETLRRQGIEAVGSESVDSTEWVLSKEVDPFGVDSPGEAA